MVELTREVPPGAETLRLLAGRKTSGEPVFEWILVSNVGSGRYRLLATPGVVLGLASGDVIELDVDDPAKFYLVSRGRNLAIHVWLVEYEDEVCAELARTAESLGGSWDGGIEGKMVILTVPVSAGFAAVERFLNDFVHALPGAEWYFGNVYGEDGVTPLGWWE